MSFIKIKCAFRLSQFYASADEVPSNPVSLVLTTPFPNTHVLDTGLACQAGEFFSSTVPWYHLLLISRSSQHVLEGQRSLSRMYLTQL